MNKKLSERNAVYLNSAALKMINYNKSSRLLEATFNNERIYQYKNVPESVWEEFLSVINSGNSAGTFINQHIKPFYECVEVT